MFGPYKCPCQEVSGQLVSVVSVLSVLVGGVLHNNLYVVAGAGLIILASPFDRWRSFTVALKHILYWCSVHYVYIQYIYTGYTLYMYLSLINIVSLIAEICIFS